MRRDVGIFIGVTAAIAAVAAALGFNRASVAGNKPMAEAVDWSKLSEFYTWDQVSASQTAAANNINNTVPQFARQNAQMLAQLTLDMITFFLRVIDPTALLTIQSWYRSPDLNTAVGGSESSDHMDGAAADINYSGGNDQILRQIYLAYIPFDQLIIYPNYIHISYDPTKTSSEQKREVLRKEGNGYTNLGYGYLGTFA